MRPSRANAAMSLPSLPLLSWSRPNRKSILQWQIRIQSLLQRLVCEYLVEDLSYVVNKDELDTFLNARWDILVDVGLAGGGDDEFWLRKGEERSMRRVNGGRNATTYS